MACRSRGAIWLALELGITVTEPRVAKSLVSCATRREMNDAAGDDGVVQLVKSTLLAGAASLQRPDAPLPRIPPHGGERSSLWRLASLVGPTESSRSCSG